MRDDVRKKYNVLTDLYKNKYELLLQIHQSEAKMRRLLNSDSISDLLDSLESDDRIIQQISIINFDISKTITEICAICGIKNKDFNKTFLGSTGSDELVKLISETDLLLHQIGKERELLMKEMQKKRDYIKQDIDALVKLRKFKKGWRIS